MKRKRHLGLWWVQYGRGKKGPVWIHTPVWKHRPVTTPRARIWRKDGRGKVHAYNVGLLKRGYGTFCGVSVWAKDYDFKRDGKITVTCKTCRALMKAVEAR